MSSPDDAPSDDELTVLASDARAGNAAAFDLLARRVRDRLRGWSKTMSRDADEADDLAQLSLIRMHERIGQFDGRSRFSSWLYRVVRNLAADLRRSDTRRAELDRRALVLTEAFVEAEADEGGDDARFAAVLRNYRSVLSTRERDVFEMVDLRGLTALEASVRLGIASSTARVLLLRARRKLRSTMLAGMADLIDSSGGAT